MIRKYLYSVTVLDKAAPKEYFRIAFWAHDKAKAFERGSQCGRVVSVERLDGGAWHVGTHGQPGLKHSQKRAAPARGQKVSEVSEEQPTLQ